MGDALSAVVLVYDDGPAAGLGHRRRMTALRDALGERGIDADLRVAGTPVTADVIVVDSYATRADDRSLYSARRHCAVDDLERDLDIDLLIDPNATPSSDTVVGSRRELRGARYAIVEPALASLPRRPSGPVERVLVIMGASDVGHAGGTIAASIRSATACEVRLVVGPWAATSVPEGVRAVVAPDGLGPELAAADLVVTAAGVTMLEALALARPTVALVVADNQRRAARAAAGAGAALVVESADDAVVAALALLEADVDRCMLSARAIEHVDGEGARRIATVIDGL